MHPEQVPIDCTGLNSWDDPRVLDWLKKAGKKKLVMAGLWTKVCLSMPVLSALADGYEVYIVTDASGGGSDEDTSAVSSAWFRPARVRRPPSSTSASCSATGAARRPTRSRSSLPAAASARACAGNGSSWASRKHALIAGAHVAPELEAGVAGPVLQLAAHRELLLTRPLFRQIVTRVRKETDLWPRRVR